MDEKVTKILSTKYTEHKIIQLNDQLLITFSEKFGSKLRRPSRTELQRLVNLAASQVGEVEKALHIYVELLNTKQVRAAAQVGEVEKALHIYVELLNTMQVRAAAQVGTGKYRS